MSLVSYEADIIERRLENQAAIVNEYQPLTCNLDRKRMLQRNWLTGSEPKSVNKPPTPDSVKILMQNGDYFYVLPRVVPGLLGFRQRKDVEKFVEKVMSDPRCEGRKLVSDTLDWTDAQFKELSKRSPEVSARLMAAYRDIIKQAA